MTTVIIVRNGVVLAVDAFSSLEAAALFWPNDERYDATGHPGVQPGWLQDGDRFLEPLAPPVDVPGTPPSRVMTRLEFLRRIPMEARLAIRAAAKADPVIEDAMALLDAATEIHLDDLDTINFIGYLTYNAGLLTAQQAADILA